MTINIRRTKTDYYMDKITEALKEENITCGDLEKIIKRLQDILQASYELTPVNLYKNTIAEKTKGRQKQLIEDLDDIKNRK